MSKENIGRLLAFVRPELDNGPILIHDGILSEEVWAKGWNIKQHNLPCADFMGLQIFEGFVTTSNSESEKVISGAWRRLTHWEMCRIRIGLLPW